MTDPARTPRRVSGPATGRNGTRSPGDRSRRPACRAGGDRGAPRRRTGGTGGRLSLRETLRDDRGGTAIEFVLLTPIMFFMIFGAVQFAMYSFAQDVAKAAAQAGAREARREAEGSPDTWQASARAKANDYVAQLAGPGLLQQHDVQLSQPSPDVVRVTVVGYAPAILPGTEMRVTASSEGPVERFVPDGG